MIKKTIPENLFIEIRNIYPCTNFRFKVELVDFWKSRFINENDWNHCSRMMSSSFLYFKSLNEVEKIINPLLHRYKVQFEVQKITVGIGRHRIIENWVYS